MPYNLPNNPKYRNGLIIEPYLRVDLGFSALLLDAEKMKTPLLMIHGMEDNNPGTFTLQTERYFDALKIIRGLFPIEARIMNAVSKEEDRIIERHVA